MNDNDARNEMLDSNPTMLWRRATHYKGGEYAVRFNGTGYEVIVGMTHDDCRAAVTVWPRALFEARFELGEWIDEAVCKALDSSLFQATANGDLVVKEVS